MPIAVHLNHVDLLNCRHLQEEHRSGGGGGTDDGAAAAAAAAAADSSRTSNVSSIAWELPRTDAAALYRLPEILGSDAVTWYPEFGCALLALGGADAAAAAAPLQLQPAVAASASASSSEGGQGRGSGCFDRSLDFDVRSIPGALELWLVMLDGWQFEVRPHGTVDSWQHAARCKSYETALCGSLADASQLGSLLKRVKDVMKRKQAEKKDSGGQDKGFQRTPAFVLWAVQKALAAGDDGRSSGDDSIGGGRGGGHREHPRGGTADVGQHTGCAPRGTTWPLFKFTIKVREIVCN